MYLATLISGHIAPVPLLVEPSETMSQAEQHAIQQLQGLKTDYQMIYEKLAEMEMELQEHQVVIDALLPVEPSRRCHRLVGGVLVERTVGEVLPALEKNKAGVKMQLVQFWY